MQIDCKHRSIALAVAASSFCVAAFAATGMASTGAVTAPTEAANAGVILTGAGHHHRHHHHRAGIATWFGPGLYGRRTACGQVLTPHVIGLAHKTLPCGTLVALSYHGRHLIAPVIDRGPYVPGVTWDLTALAARRLGVSGTARLKAKVVGIAPNTPTLGMVGNPKSTPTGGSLAEPGASEIMGVDATELTEGDPAAG
jgi:rare lipoprotein A (peptidoglycan hydrolase)